MDAKVRAMHPYRLFAALLLPLAACASAGSSEPPVCPIPGAEPADHLIREGEEHFAHLWKITSGGENAEAYFSSDASRLVLQRRNPDDGVDHDRIYVTDAATGALTQLSSGVGVTTCSYFLPGDESVVFSSTHAQMPGGPPEVDRSMGYVWPIWPEYEIWTRDLRTGAVRRLTNLWGYDAEPTVSPQGDRMVFTSTRSGDLELWTCNLDGSDLFQVTDRIGYDGGAFFSHDGKRLVFRATEFTEGNEAEEHAQYKELLSRWLIRPHSLEIYVVDVDGSNRRQVTDLGSANWAPYFFPDDSRIIFSTNHHDADMADGINFDLYAIDVDGGNLERITTEASFDSFPMFSRDGRWLAFASNRGGTKAGETNVFIAEWR